MESSPLLKNDHIEGDESLQFCDKIILEVPSTERPTRNGIRKVLIFFITGNPALIEYYRPFLSFLQSQLYEISPRPYEIHIQGQSLPGFEIASDSDPNRHLTSAQPNDLHAHIEFTHRALQTATQALISASTPPTPPRVILIGHSIGAYIALELLRLQHHSSAAIGLFPTIADLASSPNGALFTALTSVPFALPAMHLAARLVGAVVPGAWVAAAARRAAGMESRAAEVTAAWARSGGGVRAALAMGRDEMRVVGAERWGAEVWGGEARRGPKLFFYFGAEDRWVGRATRDGIVAVRGGREGGAWAPVMEIDGNGVPHGFCVREEHSRIVAAKVRQYVEEAVSLWESDIGIGQ